MADMFNYDPSPYMRQAEAGEHFQQHHVVAADGFQILADRAAAAGQQLFEDYGDNDNTIYVLYHGFAPLNNPFSCVQVPALEARQIQHKTYVSPPALPPPCYPPAMCAPWC